MHPSVCMQCYNSDIRFVWVSHRALCPGSPGGQFVWGQALVVSGYVMTRGPCGPPDDSWAGHMNLWYRVISFFCSNKQVLLKEPIICTNSWRLLLLNDINLFQQKLDWFGFWNPVFIFVLSTSIP